VAQKVVVEMVDDLDGTASDDITTVTFAIDGVSYEIDLTEDNATNLREIFSDFIRTGRRTGGRLKRSNHPTNHHPTTTADREQTKHIREWARQNNFDLADRGRIPINVIQAYEEAHTATTATSKPKARKTRAKTAELAFSG
jgi:Lsr2